MGGERIRRRVLWALLLCGALHLFLQGVWAHRAPAYAPGGPPASIAPILSQAVRTPAEDDLLFLETGLSPAAVDALLARGEAPRILEAQRALHAPAPAVCTSLIPGRVTCEDLLDRDGAPLAPLEPGDLLVTFSTHTAGWRHGHAGLAVDGETVLEASMPGSVSGRRSADHWRRYSNLLILRVRDASAEDRAQAVRFALDRLDGAPYSLLAGVAGAKEPAEGAAVKVQCAYLPWCAWQSRGRDLDGGGGRIVTVADLASSPLVDVVQVFGLDPAPYLSRAAGRT